MNTIKHALLTLCLSVSAGLAPLAQAANWVEITNPAVSGFSVGGKTVTYGSVAADSVWVFDGANPSGGQSADAIKSLVRGKFGLPSSGTGSLAFAAEGALVSSKSGSFTVNSSFDYLAVHYGGGELLFHWDTPVAANTVVSIGNLPRGLSNFRAYSSVSAVPEPATYGMLMLGLGLVGFVVRRRA
ncbi:PEP-CTERM sorting domain-containing protein [Janthinobacterium svalbardensis]|uniref:PEP-CTERM sorting domain-containing protein n=1 Tax=Janthinobacterium svalbardensis TaxID=368607 RepID=UPI002FCDCDFA